LASTKYATFAVKNSRKTNYFVQWNVVIIRQMRANKFNAIPIIVDGIRFSSTKEGSFYRKLCLQKKAIRPDLQVVDIELQPRFDIIINKQKIAFYKADFRVTYADNHITIFDVKGCKKGAAYQLFKLKKKIIEALYNIEIVEV
jgi:hypothetical protein